MRTPIRFCAALALTAVLAGCADESEPQQQTENLRSIAGLGQPLTFEAACADGDQVTIAAVGDVLLHGRLQQQAYASDIGARSLWQSATALLESADYAYANFEGPAAPGVDGSGKAVTDPGKVFDKNVYSSYPAFNYHPSLIDDLLESGIDVVSTANNHSLDRRSLGADRTIDELRTRGLAFTGTRRSDESTAPWHVVVERSGFRLAWLACTYGTNGIPDSKKQVLGCFSQKSTVLDTIESLSAQRDIDAVIVTPHWGTEYQTYPDDAQIDLGRAMLDAGAIAVLGSHPHVTQPWEKHITPDGRETFAIYSLGNFVSGQKQLVRRSTTMVTLGLVRDAQGDVRVSGVRHVPLHMREASGTLTLEVLDKDGGNMQSRALTAEMFGLYNLAPPVAPIDATPQCDPDWQPPHPLDGWIGGTCDGDDVCGGTSCSEEMPGGVCTVTCNGYCPDALGRTETFCVPSADPDNGDEGICVPRCANDADCRAGYACQPRDRHGPTELATTTTVCMPAP